MKLTEKIDRDYQLYNDLKYIDQENLSNAY